jgi:hypothetical protein
MWIGLLLAVSVTATSTGFDKPESAYWDAPSKSWYVSNISGGENDKDGKGWISRLDARGRVVKARWVEGLNAPKGIRVRGRNLYVADVDQLVVIEMRNARIKARIDAPGAKFLNDVTVGPGGDVWVSDTLANAIYRCTGDRKCDVFLQTDQLEGPNGLLVEGNRLVVAAFGLITDPGTFATKAPGRLLAVDLATKAITPLGDGKPLGNLDGLERAGADYLVTDFMAGKLFRVSKSGEASVLKDGFKNSADIGFDATRNLVALPEMSGGDVQMLRIDR